MATGFLDLPAELREQIFKLVMRADRPLRHLCPYVSRSTNQHTHMSTWYMSRNPPLRRGAHTKNDKAATPPFWSLLLTCKLFHNEAAWMLIGLNAVACSSEAEVRCFYGEDRRTFQEGDNIRTILMFSRPQPLWQAAQHMVLDVRMWFSQPFFFRRVGQWTPPRPPSNWTYPGPSENLARCLKPFTELRTLRLEVRSARFEEISTMQDLYGRLAQVMECRVDSIVGGQSTVDGRSDERTFGEEPVLRIQFVALEGAAWMRGLHVLDVPARATPVGALGVP